MLRQRERGVGNRFTHGLIVWPSALKSGTGSDRLRSSPFRDKGFSELASPILDIARKVINLCGENS